MELGAKLPLRQLNIVVNLKRMADKVQEIESDKKKTFKICWFQKKSMKLPVRD
jgi:hypothetical protein